MRTTGWSITLRVDSSSEGRQIDGWPAGARVSADGLHIGHAWVTLEGPDGQRIDAGFYPLQNGSFAGPGSVHLEDNAHLRSQDAAYRWNISEADAVAAMRYIDHRTAEPGYYHGTASNCVTFAAEVLDHAGVHDISHFVNDMESDGFIAAKAGLADTAPAHMTFHDPAVLISEMNKTIPGTEAAFRATQAEPEGPTEPWQHYEVYGLPQHRGADEPDGEPQQAWDDPPDVVYRLPQHHAADEPDGEPQHPSHVPAGDPPPALDPFENLTDDGGGYTGISGHAPYSGFTPATTTSETMPITEHPPALDPYDDLTDDDGGG